MAGTELNVPASFSLARQMDIDSVYLLFPETSDCVAFLERMRWAGKPVCPLCDRKNSTPIKHEHRHHCNVCNFNFSVTAKTVFHGTRLPLQKWFLSIYEKIMSSEQPTARALAGIIDVDKNTANKLSRRIDNAMARDFRLFCQIADCMRSWEDEGNSMGRG
jgi:transposase-like protein